MMACERGLREHLLTARRRAREFGQAIRQGERIVEDAMEAYFAVNRIWRTIDEYLNQAFIIR